MNEKSFYVEYFGFDEWHFSIFQDGLRIYSSKPFYLESECFDAARDWMMKNG